MARRTSSQPPASSVPTPLGETKSTARPPRASTRPRRYVVGISGASGAAYALRLLEQLLLAGAEVHLVVSDYGRRLLFEEAGVKELSVNTLVPSLARIARGEVANRTGRRTLAGPIDRIAALQRRLVIHPHKDVGAVIASGSFLHDGMVVIPCSSASLGAIATGSGSNLLTRAAIVTLKERRPLIVCHREMPLNLIDIRNLETLALAGAILCSPNPGFYLLPQRVEDIVDFVVGKVLDLLHVEHDLKTRWELHAAAPHPE